MIKRIFSTLKSNFNDESFKRSLKQDLQIFVALSVMTAALILFVGLSGCKRDGQTPPGTRAVVPHKVQLHASIERIQGKPLVRLTWRGDSNVQSWVIHRKTWTDFIDQRRVASFEGGENEFFDGHIEPGRTYLYFLGSTDSFGYRVRARARITIPDLDETAKEVAR